MRLSRTEGSADKKKSWERTRSSFMLESQSAAFLFLSVCFSPSLSTCLSSYVSCLSSTPSSSSCLLGVTSPPLCSPQDADPPPFIPELVWLTEGVPPLAPREPPVPVTTNVGKWTRLINCKGFPRGSWDTLKSSLTRTSPGIQPYGEFRFEGICSTQWRWTEWHEWNQCHLPSSTVLRRRQTSQRQNSNRTTQTIWTTRPENWTDQQTGRCYLKSTIKRQDTPKYSKTLWK